jgi:hypothetical protein
MALMGFAWSIADHALAGFGNTNGPPYRRRPRIGTHLQDAR